MKFSDKVLQEVESILTPYFETPTLYAKDLYKDISNTDIEYIEDERRENFEKCIELFKLIQIYIESYQLKVEEDPALYSKYVADFQEIKKILTDDIWNHSPKMRDALTNEVEMYYLRYYRRPYEKEFFGIRDKFYDKPSPTTLRKMDILFNEQKMARRGMLVFFANTINTIAQEKDKGITDSLEENPQKHGLTS